MMAPKSAEHPPAGLESTYRLIASAYPDGVPEDSYWPLLTLLNEGMSFRPLARAVSHFTGKDYAHVYNDVLKINAAMVKPDEAELERTRQRLVSCGYDEWLKED
jgi:hypothetical protein